MWFYSKDETTDFNADIANTDNFKCLKYKAKLLGNTVAKLLENTGVQPAPNQANRIFKNATIAVPLKYLSNFWRSLEMLLINCKAAGAVNANDKSNNICFTVKGTKLYVPNATLSAKDNQKLSKLLSKWSEGHFIPMNIKQKARTKIGQMNTDIFSNEILSESIGFFF